MAVLQEFKCPCCDGGIEFDSNSQKMKCPFCDNEFEVETLMSYQKSLDDQGQDQMDWEISAGQEWTEDETTGMRTYVCETCTGEIVGDASIGATECPYCGNPVVMKGQFAGDLKPDLVIPFKLDKKAAKDALKTHSGGKRLFECADLVLDNCGAVGDAAVSIEDFAERTGPTSTAVGAAILNAMVCAAVGEFKRRGVTPPVFVSANLEGGDAHNKTVMEQYKDQICYM